MIHFRRVVCDPTARLLIGPFTHPLVTSTFWCSLLKSQGRFFLLHCPHGAVPEHFIFCWRQRLHLYMHARSVSIIDSGMTVRDLQTYALGARFLIR